MHPEDIRDKRHKENMARLRELLDEDIAAVDAARKNIDEKIKQLEEAGLPKEYGDIVQTVVLGFERIGRNRIEIHTLIIAFIEGLDLVHRRIDTLSDKVAGLDKHR